jgi:hypothetical protein
MSSEQAIISGQPVIEVPKNERISPVDRKKTRFYPSVFASRPHLACHRHQAMACHPQIRERKQRDDLPGVFVESAIAKPWQSQIVA